MKISGAVFITALFLLFFSFQQSAHSADAPAGTAAAQESKDNYFKREHQQVLWKKLVPEVDFPASEGFNFFYGDLIVVRELPLVLVFGPNNLLLSPYSVIRIHGLSGDGKELEVPMPELLFGEGVFIGERGDVKIPGFIFQCSERSYLSVDEEKYSTVASIVGDQVLITDGGVNEPVTIPEGQYLEMDSTGEVGYIEALLPVDLEYYTEMEIADEEIRASILTSAQAYALEVLNEFWSRERIDLLVEGAESPQGLALAGGSGLQEAEITPTSTVQAFDQDGSVKEKTLTFSTAVSVEKSAGEVPQLTEVTIGRIKASAGDILNLKFENLDDKNLSIEGKTTTSDEQLWNIFVKVNDNEYKADGVKKFSYMKRVTQDIVNPPSVYGITIGDRNADVFLDDEYAMMTREYTEGGKLVVAGSAEPGVNVLNYNVEIIAKDIKEEREESLGKYQVELDLTELSRVEVSIDNGMGWEQARGAEDWSYSLRPNDGDEYNIKIYAFDVMDNKSEEQMEPFSFKYSYKTSSELVKETFEEQMRALMDEDRSTFMQKVSQDFSSDLEDLRDYTELESAIETRFRTGTISVRYSVGDSDAYLDTGQGSIDFTWYGASGKSSDRFTATFNYVYEDGVWKLQEVIDPDTFLRPSRTVDFIEMSSDDSRLSADGQQTTTVYATCYDKSGTIVADGVNISFSVDQGSVSPSSAPTSSGIAEVTYTAGENQGTAVITASSGNVSETLEITLDPAVATIELTSDDSRLDADGESTTTIFATCKDINGNLVEADIDVVFTVDDGSVSPTTSTTVSGVAQTTYTASTQEGVAEITATVVAVTDTIQITLDPVVATIVLTSDDSNLDADGESTTTIYATCRDIRGNLVENGTEVEFSVDLGSVFPSTALTFSGVAETTYSVTTEYGVATITATVVNVSDTIEITVDQVAAPLPPD